MMGLNSIEGQLQYVRMYSKHKNELKKKINIYKSRSPTFIWNSRNTYFEQVFYCSKICSTCTAQSRKLLERMQYISKKWRTGRYVTTVFFV